VTLRVSIRFRLSLRYLEYGEALGVPGAYKCQVRKPWWRPSFVPPPDLFFTYMSHYYLRLINNSAKVGFLNSMHGIRLRKGTPRYAKPALPLLTLNSVTMLGAEVYGRSYGGGVLKMEPREAASLPVPTAQALEAAWKRLRGERASLDRKLHKGHWEAVNKRVDEILLRDVLKLSSAATQEFYEAARFLRERRVGREQPGSPLLPVVLP
jgi:adenine-specific DNA-methyltransferase